jgi:hypothetical protein
MPTESLVILNEENLGVMFGMNNISVGLSESDMGGLEIRLAGTTP